MARSTQVENERYVLESQLRECYGRVAYCHKTHEKMAERCAKWFRRMKWLQIILSALTAGGAIGVLFEKALLPYVTAVLSITTFILNSYMKDLDPESSAQRHREAASDIWNIRESYLSLLADIRDHNVGLDAMRTRRDELQEQLHNVYRGAPHTDSKAYVDAQDALKINEELTFTEDEIDALLPVSLQRCRPSSPQRGTEELPPGGPSMAIKAAPSHSSHVSPERI